MDQVFDWCVDLLVYLAGMFGITYKEINVWIFVIIWPVVTLLLIGWNIYQWKVIQKYKQRIELNPLFDKDH